jgi:hypothetical protein
VRVVWPHLAFRPTGKWRPHRCASPPASVKGIGPTPFPGCEPGWRRPIPRRFN